MRKHPTRRNAARQRTFRHRVQGYFTVGGGNANPCIADCGYPIAGGREASARRGAAANIAQHLPPRPRWNRQETFFVRNWSTVCGSRKRSELRSHDSVQTQA